MHALNASSPAFIPYQYLQQQQQCGNAGDNAAAAATQSVFSFTATSSLVYTGNTGGGSSVSSPLAFAVSSNAGHSTAMLSPFSPSLAAKQDSLASSATFASVASAAGSGSAFSTQPSHQLRGAYARATAAAAAAAASSALHLQHTDPYSSVAAAPNSAIPAGAAAAPPHTQLEPRQRCATRKTPVVASSTAKAVYGPSVPVFHSQFINIATGSTSMTPFALLQEQSDGDDVDRLSEACDDRHAGAETAPEPATTGATAAVPRSPSTLAQGREEAEVQRVRQASNSASQQPLQRRISAATAAVLASQDARLAERSQRYAEAGQLLYKPASAITTAALSANGASSQRPSNKDASDAATAKATAKAHRHTSAFATATVSETETTTHETPKRRLPTVSTATVGTSNGNKVRTAVTSSIDDGASTMKRLHTCLASTDERTEGDRTGSVMGLTGSTRRGLPVCGDYNDDEGQRSDTVTPTTTPAKVLAAESSPFVTAAAASGDASTGRAHRRSVSREDSAVAHSESGLSESTRHTRVVHQQHSSSSSSNAHLQRAMMQLIAQIQTNNNTKGHASSSVAAATAITPHKSSIQNAALGETGATAATPAAFKTPEVERVPSARPSASKNAAIRNITTIIHTPNTSSAHRGHSSAVTKTTITSETSRHHHSAVETSAPAKDSRGAAPKGAQRSLTSCLEAISPQRGESARNSSNAARAELATTTSQAPLSSSSSAPFMPSGTAGAMPVPRSQRRGTKQGSSSATSAAAAGAAESRSPAAQANNYAVVIEGHMQRRVTAVSSTVLKRGVCVLFEEDRGIDMGRVVQCDVLDGDGAAGTLATMASATSPLSRKDRPAPVLRPATAEEEYRWLYADVKEAEATLEPCREAAARLGLPVKVVAAVYQFNKAKLTFYYESPTRVDFRPLLPSLFSRFHCRIWMARLETPEMTAAASGGVEEGAHTHLQSEKSA
ncbi:conserved hypothetical protein [Leishmania major strain Friedlin]|uniref:PSP1 C-terminal domain-containing protein n=1 Tax=Leishmania major TaxID=5664 RepID=Q4QG85_LEIMA|nr:conserved hypothetical protein [Leishmania major strain Friedlin]CAG9570991.1 PSP1_C-terminal_conserved_region_containing_protein_-_putative [Leishmania major strain Friedlin]CAJ02674.1 conserved hypothetical protein [Leishmania major strain Friedlin]|eukprot:XP_001681813.1 conserved hypothetical protein [Leishmania major strain Friedlin]